MKLKYKPDNEILDVIITSIPDEITVFCPEKLAKTINFHDYEWHYDSVGAFNKDWEDYKPKEHWFISEFGKVYSVEGVMMDRQHKKQLKEIGNYFSTKEEAEKAVEKLKAWKELKDKGFQFVHSTLQNNNIEVFIHCICEQPLCKKELTKVFGGEK